jgi:putative endonuclease
MTNRFKPWHVYILRCSDGSLYTGITNDLEKRLIAHNSGKGAKYTRSRKPVVLVWKKQMKTSTDARKLEIEIKSWPRAKKLNQIDKLPRNITRLPAKSPSE